MRPTAEPRASLLTPVSRRRPLTTLALALPVTLLAAGCAGGEAPTVSTPTADTPPVAAAADNAVVTAEPADVENVDDAGSGGAISSFDQAQPAVIQIVAQGSLRDPEVGMRTTAGSGSGFVISPDGLAVTNNHVVTGAATLEVYIGGDTTRSYNARVVGASECNDLALIDISESAPLPYLEWSDEPIATGLEIYAAGFPLGDPEYTLTRGIVAKAKAGGDLTGLSSIDHTIEHDAKTHPGNSGGPLLTVDGQVAGVHYAGGRMRETTDHQHFGIAHDLAAPVVEKMREGDFESLGINGAPVFDEALGISGIWVSGVKPGSTAAKSQVLPGDIITTLNGLPMGADGTMRDYCDVLRTAGDGSPMAIEVLRWDSQEVLRGELNNPIEDQVALTPVISFADQIGDDLADSGDDGEVTYSYEPVVDDFNQITVNVPTAWADHNTLPQTDEDGMSWPFIAAAADLDRFQQRWDEPGLVFTMTDPIEDIEGFLDEFGYEQYCTLEESAPYDDGVFVGSYRIYSACGGGDAMLVSLTANHVDGSGAAALMAQLVTDADVDALDQALRTFNTVG